MNDMLKLTIDRTARRGLILVITQDQARQSKLNLIGSLIMKGPLFVVSGDEWLPAFLLPQMIRMQTTEVKATIDRLRTVRASTCYRLFDSLANITSTGEPILVMDFLHTFYDDDIPLRTRLFRLRECCRELKRLAFYRPVLVLIREAEGEEYEKFVPALLPLADAVFHLEPEPKQIRQPALF
jgi:hypothetical protein